MIYQKISPDSPDHTNDIFSRYEILTHLKDDSSVLLVKNRESSEILVLKYLKYYNPQVLDRLMEHPVAGTPRILELTEEGNHMIVIEEYIHGKNLEQIIQKEGTFSENDTTGFAMAICRILHRLHQMKPPIIHRDIKPDNILQTSSGDIRLVDFNTAKEVFQGKKRDTTLLGTPRFAAPEQYGFGVSDHRTDIYQLGVTINYLLTAQFPTDTLSQSRLKPVIQKCTAYDADKRYQSVDELEAALCFGSRQPNITSS